MLDTKDCILAIIQWLATNSALLPKNIKHIDLRNKMIAEKGKSHIGDGTKVSQWKRRGIKKMQDGSTIRAFEPQLTIFDTFLILLVHEINGKVVNIEQGTAEQFNAQYGIRIGDYCGMGMY